MKLIRISFLATLFLVTTSCAHLFQSHARVVKSQPGKGGVIAIPQGFDGGANAKTEALEMMSSNCHGKYKITEEGESVVGTSSSAREKEEKSSLFGPSKSTSTTTSEMTEWRQTYACD